MFRRSRPLIIAVGCFILFMGLGVIVIGAFASIMVLGSVAR